MKITDNIWVDPKHIVSMVIETGSDNYTLGMTVTTAQGATFYVKHTPPYVSVFRIQKLIIEEWTKVNSQEFRKSAELNT